MRDFQVFVNYKLGAIGNGRTNPDKKKNTTDASFPGINKLRSYGQSSTNPNRKNWFRLEYRRTVMTT